MEACGVSDATNLSGVKRCSAGRTRLSPVLQPGQQGIGQHAVTQFRDFISALLLGRARDQINPLGPGQHPHGFFLSTPQTPGGTLRLWL